MTTKTKSGRGQRGLVIRNERERQIVECCKATHAWMNEHFGLETKLVFSRECNWGKDAFHAGLYVSCANEIWLNFRNLYGSNLKTILTVLGHEMRHAVQYSTGKLSNSWSRKTIGSGPDKWISGVWEGKQMFVQYKNAPWEIDAREHEEEYAILATAALGFTKELDLDLPMGTQTTKLVDETMSAFRKANPGAIICRAYLARHGKSNSAGFCWIKLDQTHYTAWDKSTKREVWNDYYDLMQSQFVPYEVVTKPYGNFSLRDLVS
jgi:hypothetical protein